MCVQLVPWDVPLQPGDTGELDSAQPVSAHYLVELSAVAPSGQDNIGLEMRMFAEGLKPYPLILYLY